ncbi:MAG TPA: hypothetical protein VHN20_19860 [Beijerinckiaceae bacterium]|nr:hypothetical protein [Beijerinckiaceae bacterium]
MKKASEYRKHAQECRALAKRMAHGEQRDQLLAMAQTWDSLAEQRVVETIGDVTPDGATRRPEPAAPQAAQRR